MPTPVQNFYWTVFYADGSSMAQFDPVTGEEKGFHWAVLVHPELYRELAAQGVPLKDQEWRGDIVKAGWVRVSPELAAKAECAEAPAECLFDELTMEYGPGEKPLLMRTNEWTWNRGDRPRVRSYKLGRDGKAEWLIRPNGKIEEFRKRP